MNLGGTNGSVVGGDDTDLKVIDSLPFDQTIWSPDTETTTLEWTTLRYVAELLARFDQTDLTRRILAAADSDSRAPPVAGAQVGRLANLQSRLGDPDQPRETLDEIGEGAFRALERLEQRVEL